LEDTRAVADRLCSSHRTVVEDDLKFEEQMLSKTLRTIAIGFSIATFSCTHSGASADKNMEDMPLENVADVPMPGPAVRFDYQSLDQSQGRLYISHMNAGQLVVFDIKKNKVVSNLDGFPKVHGVWAVPDLGKVYASTTGEHKVAVVDMKTLQTVARVGPIDYPDGLAYAPTVERVFVSDEGGVDAVIDTKSNTLIKNISLGGGAGNTVYDSGSGRILVAVHQMNELVSIDPASMQIVSRIALSGGENPHGIALDVANRLAFVACEENAKLFVVDLKEMKVVASYPVGEDPDVLAFDPGLGLLYVSAELGQVRVFHEKDGRLVPKGGFTQPHAHTVTSIQIHILSIFRWKM
jgi:DNA-binding beta-propeller fold protein YncE